MPKLELNTKQGPQDVHKATFADEVTAVEELQHSMPFIQLILRQSQKVPYIVLYTQDQLEDLKSFVVLRCQVTRRFWGWIRHSTWELSTSQLLVLNV